MVGVKTVSLLLNSGSDDKLVFPTNKLNIDQLIFRQSSYNIFQNKTSNSSRFRIVYKVLNKM